MPPALAGMTCQMKRPTTQVVATMAAARHQHQRWRGMVQWCLGVRLALDLSNTASKTRGTGALQAATPASTASPAEGP